MWWPRLLKAHASIAWDDYEKDYSDLPEEVLQRHRWEWERCCSGAGGRRRGAKWLKWAAGVCGSSTAEVSGRRRTSFRPLLGDAMGGEWHVVAFVLAAPPRLARTALPAG